MMRRALFAMIPAALFGRVREPSPVPVDMRTINEMVAAQNRMTDLAQLYILRLSQNRVDIALWGRVLEARNKYTAAFDRMR